jgi:hypothetical protein
VTSLDERDHVELRVTTRPPPPIDRGPGATSPRRSASAPSPASAPLRLIATYDGDEGRVSVRVAPTLAMMRSYDGEPSGPPEVQVECVASAPEGGLVLLPLRVIAGTTW